MAYAAMSAATVALFRCLSVAFQKKLQQEAWKTGSQGVSAETRQSISQMIWAFSFAGIFDEDLISSARVVLMMYASGLDGVVLPLDPQLAEEKGSVHGETELACEPDLVVDMFDRLVLHKPKGWEVDQGLLPTDCTCRFLSNYLRSLSTSNPWPICYDIEHQRGFVHRLDVPSSGLILVAKTYAAFYDLQLQLRAGHIDRDYVALSHGWVPTARRCIAARVLISTSSSTVSICRNGRPSHTEIKVRLFAELEYDSNHAFGPEICSGKKLLTGLLIR